MSNYTLGWHDQSNEYHEIGEYATDAFEAVNTQERMFRIYTNILFLWKQLRRRNNEKNTYHINLTYLYNHRNRIMVLSTIRLGTSYICMKKFNTWVLDTTIYILDFLYRGRDFQRFWVLEVIARAPYFAFISVLHFVNHLDFVERNTYI